MNAEVATKAPPWLPGEIRAEKTNTTLWKPNKDLRVLNVHFNSFLVHVNKTIKHKKNPAPKPCRVRVLYIDFLEGWSHTTLKKARALWHSVKLCPTINTRARNTHLIEPEINTSLVDHSSSSNYPWGSILVGNGDCDTDPKGLAYYEVE